MLDISSRCILHYKLNYSREAITYCPFTEPAVSRNVVYVIVLLENVTENEKRVMRIYDGSNGALYLQ